MATKEKIDANALDEAMLVLRPQVWNDIQQAVLLGELPAAQLAMRVEMWMTQFRPFLEKAIAAYKAAEPLDHDRVTIPTNEEEAALMALLGTNWLEKHAPHRLKRGANDNAH